MADEGSQTTRWGEDAQGWPTYPTLSGPQSGQTPAPGFVPRAKRATGGGQTPSADSTGPAEGGGQTPCANTGDGPDPSADAGDDPVAIAGGQTPAATSTEMGNRPPKRQRMSAETMEKATKWESWRCTSVTGPRGKTWSLHQMDLAVDREEVLQVRETWHSATDNGRITWTRFWSGVDGVWRCRSTRLRDCWVVETWEKTA